MFNDTKHIKYKKHIMNTVIPCTNCGIVGHTYKGCMAPVNSYGIIACRFRDEWDEKRIMARDMIESNLCKQGTAHRPVITGTEECGQLDVLLIRRKDSLRFVEFVRGKYDVGDEKYLYQMFSNMTNEEREFVRSSTFEQIWKKVWGSSYTRNYKNEYEISKTKFNELRLSGLLEKILSTTTTRWATPEWGFPKGRRNPRETDFECAVREFVEETGIKQDDFSVVTNMEPICETFYGDNHVHYCHKYYIAFCGPNVEPVIERECPHQEREIGDIRWMSVNEAISLIRDENVEKREILLRASSILKHYITGFGGKPT